MEKIGILALQGDFLEHEKMIQSIDESYQSIRITTPEQIKNIDRLIMPGGESTTMNRLGILPIKEKQVLETLNEYLDKTDIPILATCAGIILLAKEILSVPERKELQPVLKRLPIRILRNNYGRQQNSFEIPLTVKGLDKPFPGVFIRAPVVELLKENGSLEILASHHEAPVLLKQKNIIASTFHPELTNDPRIHQMFLNS